MAIGPGNKITTTGLIDKQPMIPEVPVMEVAQEGPPGGGDPEMTSAAPIANVAESQEGPLNTKYPGVKDLSDEDIESLQAALSPSVKEALVKIFPDLAQVIGKLGSDEPNVIFPLSIVKRFAMQRYGGQDENEAVQNFMTDVISPDIEQAQMETQNNVPPGTEQPTETAGLVEPTGETGLMSSPQNMETV